MKKQNNEDKQLPTTNSSRNDSGAVNYLSSENIQLPPYLSKDDPLEALGFPVRLENALKFHAGITTIGQFMEIRDDKLIKTRNIGYRSLKYFEEVKKRIREQLGILADSQPQTVTEISQPEELDIPNDQLISNLLGRCGTEKSKNIIVRRYGLMSGERQTLEEIGESYKVTRERIRQIQAKALRKMKHPATKSRKPLIAITERLLYGNGGIMTDEEADAEVPKILSETTKDGSSVMDLLSDLGWLQNCRIGDFKIYSPFFNGVQLCSLSEQIIKLIKKESLGIDVRNIIKKTYQFGRIKDTRFNPNEFVLRYCHIDPRIEEFSIAFASGLPGNDGMDILFRPYTANHFSGKAWVALMLRVLETEQMPLHFTEITNKVNDLLGNTDRRLDVRRAHSMLIDSEIFAHSGIRGTYGLTSWGLRRETTPQLVEECLKKAGFPLHWRQIFNYVSKYKDSKPGNILSVLKFNGAFRETEGGIYWFREK